MADVLQPFVNNNSIAGAVVLVANKDEVLDLEAVGYADLKTRKPMQTNDVFAIASMTKPMTATTLMMLVDEGKVNVDDPVEKYLPEFKGQMYIAEKAEDHVLLKKPARPLLVRDVLSHTGGLLYSTPVEDKPKLDHLPLRDMIASAAMLPLQFDPGTKYLYSSDGLATAARIVEVVSGMPYERFLDERLLKPLGMNDTTFWPNEEQLQRLAMCYLSVKSGLREVSLTKFTYPLSDTVHRFPEPGAGLFSTAGDVAKFCQMMLNGGTYKGTRYLSEASVRAMTSKQTGSLVPVQYGFGWFTDHNQFRHPGSFGTSMAVDPARGLITIVMTQHLGDMPGGIIPAVTAAADKLTPATGR